MFGLGTQEILILVVLGVLLFGRKLPDIGRSLGKTVVEFKKGVKGLEEEADDSRPMSRGEVVSDAPRPPQRVTPAAPKFDDNPPA